MIDIGFVNACHNSICCDESTAKTVYDAWVDFKAADFETAESPITVDGFTDSPDRASRKLAFMPSEVNCISVYRMY